MRHSCALSICLLAASVADAADTVEPYPAGALDVESFVGLDNLNRPSTDRSVTGELVLGYGIVDRLSMNAVLELDGAALASLSTGLIASAIDTDHFDLDLLVAFGAAGQDLRALRLNPGVELNLDRTPDLGSYGIYLRIAVALESHMTHGDRTLHLHPEGVAGGYVTLTPRQQLLLEYESTFDGPGGLGVGYNVTLNATFQLLCALQIGLPADSEPASLGLVAGMIVTLPV